MKIYIKNMVCNRCKMVVRAELERVGLHILNIDLGEVEITEELNTEQKAELNQSLMPLGFKIIDDKRGRLIEKIKTTILELVHYSEDSPKTNFSKNISEKLHLDYNYLSNLFSEVEGQTIERYFINQKIEKVKESLIYDEFSLSEIAYKMNYSSVSHLSRQFKKVTGFTPSDFKQLKKKRRIPIEEL